MLGFHLDLGFGTRRRILDFRLFLWFCFTSSGKPSAKGGVLTKDLARRLTAPIGLACPHQPRLPPPASLAPIGLACPCRPRLPLSASSAPMARRTARHWYSALGSGFGSRHWVFLLSLSYIKSIVFLLFVSTDNSSSSPSSSRVNKYDRLRASSWRPDRFGDLDCHQNRHTSPLSVLITGYDVGVR